MVEGIILIFYGGLKMFRILKPSLADLPILASRTKYMLLPLPIKLYLRALIQIR